MKILDTWSKATRFELAKANRERRIYRRSHLHVVDWLEIKHDGKQFTLSAWIEPLYLARAATFFLLPARRHVEAEGLISRIFARPATHAVNQLLAALQLPCIDLPSPPEPGTDAGESTGTGRTESRAVPLFHIDWSLPMLAGLILLSALICYGSLTARVGFKPGLYVASRGLKLGILSSMLIPALTALGIHYWVAVRSARKTLIRGLSVLLAVAYFLGSFSYGLQRSGLISLILLNESGYYCVEKQDEQACVQTKQALGARPEREKDMIIRYADRLISDYKSRTAAQSE